MFTMICAAAQPGILPPVFPGAWMVLGSFLGGFPLVALAPLAVLGAGLVSVLVLIAKEEQARRVQAGSRTDVPIEPPFSQAA